jgi:hypothetical protein
MLGLVVTFIMVEMRDQELKLEEVEPHTHYVEPGKVVVSREEVERRREVCDWDG